MMRTKMLGLAAVIASGLSTITAASAGPMGFGAVASPEAPLVERVADGCGPGFHQNPWGRCRPNGYGYGSGYGPPRGFYGPPRGYGYDRGYDRPPPRRFYDGY